MAELDWHYGPTDTDPDPGKRWHRDCGGEVWYLDGDICSKCEQQGDDEGDTTSRYTIRRAHPRLWLLHCAECCVYVHCVSWDVAVLMMGCEHSVHTTAAGGSKVSAVVHPMTGEPLSSVHVWRDRNLFFRLPEFGGASL